MSSSSKSCPPDPLSTDVEEMSAWAAAIHHRSGLSSSQSAPCYTGWP